MPHFKPHISALHFIFCSLCACRRLPFTSSNQQLLSTRGLKHVLAMNQILLCSDQEFQAYFNFECLKVTLRNSFNRMPKNPEMFIHEFMCQIWVLTFLILS